MVVVVVWVGFCLFMVWRRCSKVVGIQLEPGRLVAIFIEEQELGG